MEQIRFVSALEGAFEYDRTLKMDSGEVRGAMGLGVGATLLLSETKDVVGMLFSKGSGGQVLDPQYLTFD